MTQSGARALRPPRLAAGARVALISPAGPVSEERVEKAIQQCNSLGVEPVVGEAARERHGYLAGPDQARARDVARAVADPEIDAIWALRGGYGTMRLLQSLDLSPLRKQPKAFIGFSDNTALHLALARSGVVSFHGPHAGGAFPPFSEACFRAILFENEAAGELPLPPSDEAPVTLAGGVAEGELIGGNLSLLAALCGTAIAMEARDRIVVLEEVGEATYRIDRSITQLLLCGALDGAAGLALGRFTERPAATHDRQLEDVFGEVAIRLGVPAVLGFPVGHVDHNWCLPLCTQARLDADRRTLAILEPAVV
jgi:muramoyltetrapeptide carboxypeptidase